MARNVTVNGTTYVIPDQGDNFQWGSGQGGTPGVTPLLQALSSSTLQPTGGAFALSSDVDFGTTNGTKAAHITLHNNASPSTASSGEARVVSHGNRAVVSENAGPYLLIRNVEYVNITDPAYGCVGDGVTDNATAFAAALAACRYSTGKMRALYIPKGDFYLRSTQNIAATRGLVIVGEGQWASRLIFDPTIASSDGLVINSSTQMTLEGFSIMGKKSNPMGKALKFAYNSVVYATQDIALRDIWIGSDDLNEAMDYGIYWDDAYGNNSEVRYFGCHLTAFKEAGVILPGTQQKAHNFFGCHIHGNWSGTGTTGGKYGIRAGGGIVTPGSGGSFQVYGGNISDCRTAGVSLEYPNDPIVIHGVQSENCYRFADMGSGGSSSQWPVEIRGCRLDAINSCATDYIRLNGSGPFDISGNTLHTHSTLTNISLYHGGNVQAKITGNAIKTPGSDQVSLINNQGNNWGEIEIHSNTYTTAGNALAFRVEELDQNVPAGVGIRVAGDKRQGFYNFSISYTALTTNAISQTKTVLPLPKGARIKHVSALVYDAFTHGTATTITCTVGNSGGTANDYLTTFNLHGSDGRYFGKSNYGSELTGGPDDSHFFAATNLQMTITLNAGTVGNGTITNLTRGLVFFQVEFDVVPRFVSAA